LYKLLGQHAEENGAKRRKLIAIEEQEAGTSGIRRRQTETDRSFFFDGHRGGQSPHLNFVYIAWPQGHKSLYRGSFSDKGGTGERERQRWCSQLGSPAKLPPRVLDPQVVYLARNEPHSDILLWLFVKLH
jgi:hypothetical protein